MRTNAKDFIDSHEHINYCEAIIYQDGTIEYANPSHIKALERATGKDVNWIYDRMPITSSPLHWLIEYTGCVCVWSDFSITPTNPTKEQMNTLELLIENNLTKFYSSTSVNEYELETIECAKRDVRLISTGEPSTLKTYKKIAYFIDGLREGNATKFIKEKIEESAEGENTEVIADESQMMYLLAHLASQNEELPSREGVLD